MEPARRSSKFEIGLWQKATLGIAQVGSEQGYVDAALQQVAAFIEGMRVAELGAQEVEFLHY